MTERMKSNLTRLLKKFPKGIWCWDLPEHYETEYGIPLDCREIGYVSVSQMMRSVPELFKCILVDGSDCKVYDAGHPFTQEASISRSRVAQIKELVTAYPSPGIKGIYEDNFCNKFKEVFHTEFNFKEMGFGTLHSLFETLDGEVIQLVRICDRYRICPLMDKENDDAGVFFPPYKKEDETFIKRFPSDVVGPLDIIARLQFPQNAQSGSFLEIIVGEITNPGFFWAQLRGSEYHTSLSKMMDAMEVFYGNSSNDVKYTMPAEAIAVGVICVAPFLDLPHRCRITDVDVGDSLVRVSFTDFGTITLVERSSLRFLHKRFQELPMQAFRCSLYNLKPSKGRAKYPREVGERFLQLVEDKGMVAHIGTINHEATTMSLILIDTSGEDDVCINDIIVDEGLADYRMVINDPEVEVTHSHMAQWDQINSCRKEVSGTIMNTDGTAGTGTYHLPHSQNLASKSRVVCHRDQSASLEMEHSHMGDRNPSSRVSGSGEYTDRDGFPLTLLERIKRRSENAVDNPNLKAVPLDPSVSHVPHARSSINTDKDGFPLTLLERLKQISLSKSIKSELKSVPQETNSASATHHGPTGNSNESDIPLTLLERLKQKSANKSLNAEIKSALDGTTVTPGGRPTNNSNESDLPLTLLERLQQKSANKILCPELKSVPLDRSPVSLDSKKDDSPFTPFSRLKRQLVLIKK